VGGPTRDEAVKGSGALHRPWLPPRGRRAPWTLGIEEGDAASSSLEEVVKALGPEGDTEPQQNSDLMVAERVGFGLSGVL
jgi:hypothetical protein